MLDGLLDFLHDLLPTSWFESAQEHFGQGLTDEVVAQSVHEASVFFGMEDPINVHEDWTTGVMTNMSWTENDDVLIFSRDQMAEMGITDKEGFDLVMTHEGAHRMLQNMHQQTGFNSHQEELCCDYMAGVRAGLNEMDYTKMASSLANSTESETHPDGFVRVESIVAGAEFAQEYMDKYHKAPTFSDCLEHFEQTEVCTRANVKGLVTLSPESSSAQDEHIQPSDDEIQKVIEKADNVIAKAEILVAANDTDLGIDSQVLSEVDHLNGEVNEDESTMKGMFVDSRKWNTSQAKSYEDLAKAEAHRAEIAARQGDFAKMAEHSRLAVYYQKKAEQYTKDALASSK